MHCEDVETQSKHSVENMERHKNEEEKTENFPCTSDSPSPAGFSTTIQPRSEGSNTIRPLSFSIDRIIATTIENDDVSVGGERATTNDVTESDGSRINGDREKHSAEKRRGDAGRWTNSAELLPAAAAGKAPSHKFFEGEAKNPAEAHVPSWLSRLQQERVSD